MPSSEPLPHHWKFFRTGGLVQVILETGDDLMALDQLDQKLWVALGCPVRGLEIDEKTLALIDTDADGRIAVPDIIAAVKWAGARLNDPGELLAGRTALPLSALVSDGAEGVVLREAARNVVAVSEKPETEAITVADVVKLAQHIATSPVKGDGVLPPESSDDATVQALIRDIITATGGTPRPVGGVGVTPAQIDQFYVDLEAYLVRVGASADREIAVLGDLTEMACTSLAAVSAKVQDYFARCRLAAYDSRAVRALNRNEEEYLALLAKDLAITAAEVRGFPLSRIEAGRPLPLLEGVNPAWAAELAALHAKAVGPIFGEGKRTLSEDEWNELNAKLAAYTTWLAGKGGGPIEKLGLARAKEIQAGGGRAALATLVAKDKAMAPEYRGISDLERLVRYHRDLRVLLRNFVNFADFYSPEEFAAFQAGVLFFDSRSTELCVRVDSVNPIAAMSSAYIAYCRCTRVGSPEMTIAACVTQGDADYLFVGRNGIFYDRQGRQWYAVVTSIVDNPISIRQAFWSPYKKFLRFIEATLAKRAAAADAAASDKLAGAAIQAGAPAPTAVVPPPGAAPAQPRKFDLAMITGIGVAIGSIGTFLATVFAKAVDVPSWQIPLIVLGLILVISLPSMFIAALKLKHRTLGPILEGNGWAINGRVKINIPFGAALTLMAQLPPGAESLREDPYEDKAARRRRRAWIAIAVFVVLAALAIWWLPRDAIAHDGVYFWQR